MTTSENRPTRSILVAAFKWLLAIGLLGGLFWNGRNDLAEFQKRQILWDVFAVALGIRFLSLLATFCRWRLLVRGIGLPLSYRQAFRLGMLGEGCNLMGPGAVGGDLVKAALLAKDHPNRIASVMASAFLDRVLGLWSLFVLGALASLNPAGTKPGPELQFTVWVLWGGALAGLLGIALMLIPAFTHSSFMHWLTTWKFVGRIVKELMDSMELYQGKKYVVIGAAALGLLGHLGFLTVFYFCANSIHRGQDYPGFIDHIVGLPLPEAASAVPLTPGGLGVLEGGVAWFYQKHQESVDPNSTEEQLKTASMNGKFTAICYRVTTLICGAVGFLYYLSSRKEIEAAVHHADDSIDEPAVAA